MDEPQPEEKQSPTLEAVLDRITKGAVAGLVALCFIVGSQYFQVQGFMGSQSVVNQDNKTALAELKKSNGQLEVAVGELKQQTDALKEALKQQTDALKDSLKQTTENLDRRLQMQENKK